MEELRIAEEKRVHEEMIARQKWEAEEAERMRQEKIRINREREEAERVRRE